MSKRRTREGFTLLEVMVAIAILAICLSAVFSAEAGAVRMANRARKLGLAALLARCKMGEIEEQIAKEGLPATFDSGTDGCCEDAELDDFECKWELEPIILPDTMFAGEEEGVLDDDPKAAATDLMSGGSGDPNQLLSAGAGAIGGLTAMAMQYVYPVLKPAFESQIRRATVTVSWREGRSEHSFDVTQYVVAEQPAPPILDTPPEMGGGASPPPQGGNPLGAGRP